MPPPLRILLLAPTFPLPAAHGGAARLYNYLRQLARRGAQVSLATLVEEAPGREHLRVMQEICRDVRVVRRAPTPFARLHLLAFRKYYVREMMDVIRELEATRAFDVAHFEYTQMGVYLHALPPAVARVLGEVDISFLTLWRRAMDLRGAARAQFAMRAALAFQAELFVARRVDRVFAMSEFDARVLRRLGPLPVTVVPNGVDLTAEPYVDPWHPRPRLLFVGHFDHSPNVEAVLRFAADAYPRIRGAVRDVEWLIAGARPPSAVRALAARGEGIAVLGYMEDLASCYAESAVFVAPITRGSGTRVKILQAMARGIPVVSTAVGAEGLAVTPGRDLLIGDTPSAFAEHVVRLLRDSALANSLRRNARTLIERHYDYGRLVELVEEGYRLARARASLRSAWPQTGAVAP